MSDLHSTITHLLIQFLSHSPEPGSRLKLRLKLALMPYGYEDFNEKRLGFKKFTDYLEKKHGDTVVVTRSAAHGDVLVALRSTAQTLVMPAVPSPVIRSDFWQAFINTDPNRRRFFNRSTGNVQHFLSKADNADIEEKFRSSETYIEIKPISGEEQIGWMKQFLSNLKLSEGEMKHLESIVSSPFSSASNGLFIQSLGNCGQAWRDIRTSKVIEVIERWATSAGIDKSTLYRSPQTFINTESKSPSTCPPEDADSLSPKEQVIRLLDLLSEKDVSRFVLPGLLHIPAELDHGFWFKLITDSGAS